MKANESGNPFGDDYSRLRGDPPAENEHAAARQQVKHLEKLAADPDYLNGFVRRIQARRADTAVVQLEPVRSERGATVFVARASFLAERKVVDINSDLLRDKFGLTVVDTDPRSPLVRLERIPAEQIKNVDGSTPELADELRRNRIPVALNHIVPLGVIMKAEGGPEPTTRRRGFPAVVYPTRGPAPVVAVIDTGISVEQRSDGYLDQLVHADNIDQLDAFPPPHDGFLDAAAGHGTFTAGVVQQVAPTAQLRIYRVADSDGACTDDDVATGIRRAAAEGARIINLSLGTSTVDDQPPPAMLAAIADVISDDPGILIVAAAGNDGDTVPVWPAALAPTGPGPTFANVVSVAGLDPASAPSTWSSHGDWVRCSTIGEGVVSTYVIGTEDGPLINDPDPDTYGPDSWAIWTGSSFAAPQIAGAVARLCHEQGSAPLDALDDLLNGTPDDAPGWGHRVTVLPGT